MKKVTVTMHDVARLAGVSQTTVSLILNQSGNTTFSQETMNRVYAAAAQLNYKVKRAGGQEPRSKAIMVLMANVTNPYYTAMLSSIEDVCYGRGCQVISCCTYHNAEAEKMYLEMAISNNYPGVILLSPPDDPKTFAEVSSKIPMVTICDRTSDLATDIVELNNRLAGQMAAEYLHKLGHQRIAVLTSSLERNTARTERLNGLRSYFLSTCRKMIWCCALKAIRKRISWQNGSTTIMPVTFWHEMRSSATKRSRRSCASMTCLPMV